MSTAPLVVAAIDTDPGWTANEPLVVQCFARHDITGVAQLDDGTFEVRTAHGGRNVDVLLVPERLLAEFSAAAHHDPSRVLQCDRRDVRDRLAGVRPRAATPNIDYERGPLAT